jgi:magnesium chelatase family protein
VRARVVAARERQARRFAGTAQRTNADMTARDVQRYCVVDESSDNLMRSAMKQLQLSARGYHRILKLSRTIADLAGDDDLRVHHLAEALQYRPKVVA